MLAGLGTDDVDPHGTAFPQSLAMAATFDPELVYKASVVIATELRGQNNKSRYTLDHAFHLKWSKLYINSI
jgi:beta-glucosidase-like glycosyl hydrolase